MITSLTWIPRGAARARPVRFELSPEELERIKFLATKEKKEQELEENEHCASGATFAAGADDDFDVDTSDLPAALRMDEYDNDDVLVYGEEEETEAFDIMEHGDLALAIDADSDDDEDADDDEILPSDALLVTAMTEDEYSHLEIHLLSEDGNLYVHHDISLPDFPICLAWMDIPPFQQADGGQLDVGNFIAVGTFAPTIEIWNLDVLDPLEPTAALGGYSSELTVKKKSKKTGKTKLKPALLPGSHSDAVMALSWNKTYRQALASGSADKTVKIWDVTSQACSHTFTHHTGKVQSVVWHPQEAWLLATGAFDRTVVLIDCRTGNQSASYEVAADIEAMAWDPFLPFHLYCSLEDGQLVCVDVRNSSAPLFSFQAHDETLSSLSFSRGVPGMLATASTDCTVKIWDVDCLHVHSRSVVKSDGKLDKKGKGKRAENATVSSPSSPHLVAYKTMNAGKLFSLQYYSDDPFMLACAGDSGVVAVWESDEQEFIRSRFESRVIKRPSEYALETKSFGISGGGGVVSDGDVSINRVESFKSNADVFEDLDVEFGESLSEVKKSGKKNKKDKKKAIKSSF